MKGLTPEEFAELSRLLLPFGESRMVDVGSREHSLRNDLVEQGRAIFVSYPAPELEADGYLHIGRHELTPSGREALKLWPLVRRFMEARSAPPKADP